MVQQMELHMALRAVRLMMQLLARLTVR